MRASKLTALQTAMQQREQRHRTDRKRRAALAWRGSETLIGHDEEEVGAEEEENDSVLTFADLSFQLMVEKRLTA